MSIACFLFFHSYLLTEPNEPVVQLVVPSSPFLRSLCTAAPPYRNMSAAQTQNDREQRWGCLESLGLSQKELVLAEALQMEYDALARHRQDKSPANTLPPDTSKSSPSRSEPTLPRRVPSPPWNNLQQGVSGSDPMLNHVQPGVSNLSHSSGESHGFSKEPRYILDEWESDFEGTSQLLSKGLPSLDEPPPPVPPRNPIPQNDPFIVHRSSVPRDVNLFTPEVDQPKLSPGDALNYDNLNDSLSKLNGDWLSPNRSRRVNGDKSGKAVARSNTLPPQVPPRTYVPGQKSTRSQRRVSVDPVSIHRIFFMILEGFFFFFFFNIILKNSMKWLSLFLLSDKGIFIKKKKKTQTLLGISGFQTKWLWLRALSGV